MYVCDSPGADVSIKPASSAQGAPPAHRPMQDLPACVPAFPSGSCPPHTLPRGRTPSWAQVQIQPWPCHYRDERRPLFFSLKPLMNPNKSVFPDYLFLLLLYMTYFYSLLFHQPSLNLTYVPRRSTARGNVSNPG